MGVVHRYCGKKGNFEWEGVPVKTYQRGGAVGGSVRIVVGSRDGARNFAIRYFEIMPGGHSAFDCHDHDHGVYILRGRARLLLGEETLEVDPGDVIYIPPNEKHQFETIGHEPLGFLCVVPRKKTT